MTKRGDRKHKNRPLVKKDRQIWNLAELPNIVNANKNTIN